jgi:hypothetical protein
MSPFGSIRSRVSSPMPASTNANSAEEPGVYGAEELLLSI